MAAYRIENSSKKKDARKFTAYRFLGPLYEIAALAHCRRKKYRVLKRNLRLKSGEIDILAADLNGWVLIEVRGRSNKNYRPIHFLSHKKKVKLFQLRDALVFRYRRSVRVEFIEVLGVIPSYARGRFGKVLLRCWPEILGLELAAYHLE